MDSQILKRQLASKEKEKTREPTVQASLSTSRSSRISRASSRKRKRTSFERDQAETGQNEPVRTNQPSEASRSRSSSVSMASTSRKRQRSSAERNQNREMNNDPLNTLARMLMTETVLTTKERRPMQGYVKREKYESLMEKYNNLVSDYQALQQRFQQTLECLGSLGDSGVESDIDDKQNDEVPNENANEVVPESTNEEIPENTKGEISEKNDEEVNEVNEEMPENNNEAPEGNNQAQGGESEEETEDVIVNTDAYITDVQWRILLRSQSVRLFVENTLQIIFDQKALLDGYIPSDDGSSSATFRLDKKKIEVVRVLLDRYLEERRPTISDEEKETGRREWMNHVSLYITRLRQKKSEGLL